MIGHAPDVCPFCGAGKESFISADQCSEKFKVTEEQVADGVFELCSSPKLGLEHHAYSIESEQGRVCIDCPSCFDHRVEPPDIISFTHHHFLGACNMYSDYFKCSIAVPEADTRNYIAAPFLPWITKIKGDFSFNDVEAMWIDGHTKGFTAYFWHDVGFACDLIIANGDNFMINPYGPKVPTMDACREFEEEGKKRNIQTVCTSHGSMSFDKWSDTFKFLLSK
ncbi:MAG: MBL fold metallo-hydrolase [Lentisphaerae bacterium]|nr:MBL fold metallo-hydrolase [Lentisphaerota bacterium]